MNDKLQDQITALLEKTLSGVDASTNFLHGEIPLYIQELLLWHGVYSFSMFFTGIALSILTFYLFLFRYKVFISSDSFDSDDYFGLMLIGWLIAGLAILVLQIVFTNLTWLQVWITPRVFLVEYAAKLAGS